VSFEGAFQFWSHRRLAVMLGPRLAVWQLARMLRLRTAPHFLAQLRTLRCELTEP